MIGFGPFGMERIINTLTDYRLVKIVPRTEGFFAAVLNYKTSNENINLFIRAIREVKLVNLETFYKPIYDPSEDQDRGLVIYQKGNKPAINHSYNWWVETAARMPTVEGKAWKIASEYQYYAFLVDIINKKLASGENIAKAMEEVVNDSTNLGHYRTSEGSTYGEKLELTGSRCVCGFYDLANTYKLLKCSNKENDSFWLTAGSYEDYGKWSPLADLKHSTLIEANHPDGVAMLVL